MGKEKEKAKDTIGYCKCCGDIFPNVLPLDEETTCGYCGSEWNVIPMIPPFTEEDYFESDDIGHQVDEIIFKEYIEPSGEYDPAKAEKRIQKINSRYFCKCCGKIWDLRTETCPFCGYESDVYIIKPPFTDADYIESEDVRNQVYKIVFKEYIEPSGVYDPIKARERIKSEAKEEEERKKLLQEALSNPRVICPYCGSQNTHRIHPLEYLSGFFSTAYGKQWECGDCSSYF